MRRDDLFVFRRDEQGGDTNELKLIQLNNLAGQEAVDDVDGKIECLGEQLESLVDLDEPIVEDIAIVPVDMVLMVHVFRIGYGGLFEFA